MANPENKQVVDLLCIIANYGQARKIVKFALSNGCTGATVSLGKGTVLHNKWLNKFDLTDSRKEIILMMLEREQATSLGRLITEKFKFEKPNHGIAFIMPIKQTLGSHFYDNHKTKNEVSSLMYQAIYIIVEKGRAEDVIEVATKAGARGGTIINARGSGVHETSKVFNIEITPEKEVVLILAKEKMVDDINVKLVEKFKINEPGNGIIFVQDVRKVYGLH